MRQGQKQEEIDENEELHFFKYNLINHPITKHSFYPASFLSFAEIGRILGSNLSGNRRKLNCYTLYASFLIHIQIEYPTRMNTYNLKSLKQPTKRLRVNFEPMENQFSLLQIDKAIYLTTNKLKRLRKRFRYQWVQQKIGQLLLADLSNQLLQRMLLAAWIKQEGFASKQTS